MLEKKILHQWQTSTTKYQYRQAQSLNFIYIIYLHHLFTSVDSIRVLPHMHNEAAYVYFLKKYTEISTGEI